MSERAVARGASWYLLCSLLVPAACITGPLTVMLRVAPCERKKRLCLAHCMPEGCVTFFAKSQEEQGTVWRFKAALTSDSQGPAAASASDSSCAVPGRGSQRCQPNSRCSCSIRAAWLVQLLQMCRAVRVLHQEGPRGRCRKHFCSTHAHLLRPVLAHLGTQPPMQPAYPPIHAGGKGGPRERPTATTRVGCNRQKN